MKILVALLIFLSSINLSFSQEEKKIDIKKSKIEWNGSVRKMFNSKHKLLKEYLNSHR